MKFGDIRKKNLELWKTRSKRVFKITDNFNYSIECEWQDKAFANGRNHISIFCSLGQFVSHITDLLRDYRYDKYMFNQSQGVNEILFRYYSRILLITSEILTDFQDLYIIADNKFTTKHLGGVKGQTLKDLQDSARLALSNNSNKIKVLLDYINKVCKHKTSNLHICNNHIEYLFGDFDKNIKQYKKRVEMGNIKNFTSYDPTSFKKFNKANFIVVPSLEYVIDIIINGYSAIDKLFKSDNSTFEFICDHFEDN